MNKIELFRELIERSQNEETRADIYLNGQAIVGIVAQIINEQAIELRSQQYHKAVVLLESVDAMVLG
jgi:hypothetical protein